MPRLRIGTCSWRFPSWAGIVYSAAEGIDDLAEYARRYDTVEVDRWFWSLFGGGEPKLPDPADVEGYRRSVPSDFRFSVKAPDAITLTHFRPKSRGGPLLPNPHFLSPDLFARFTSSLGPLGETLGPIILQFGYLNRRHLHGQAELLERLAGFVDVIPSGHQLALEIRNPMWLNAKHFEFANRHGLLPVLLQGYWMPPVWDTYREHRDLLHGAGTVVIRLHGPDREGMEERTGRRWDRLVVERDDELREIVGMSRDLLDAGADAYLNVNNHYEGSAPLTIERIEAMLGVRASDDGASRPHASSDRELPGMVWGDDDGEGEDMGR